MDELKSCKAPNSKTISSESNAISKAGRFRLWRIKNAEAIAEMNAYVDKNGLPLDQYRQFWPYRA